MLLPWERKWHHKLYFISSFPKVIVKNEKKYTKKPNEKTPNPHPHPPQKNQNPKAQKIKTNQQSKTKPKTHQHI